MRCLVNADLRNAEWIVTAYKAQEPRMIEVVERGLRPHTITGMGISGADQHLVEYDREKVGHNSDEHDIAIIRRNYNKVPGLDLSGVFFPRTMSIDQGGKKANHGLNYQMGPVTFADWIEIPLADAKTIHYNYHKTYKGLGRWYGEIHKQLKAGEPITNCFGEQRRFLDLLTDKVEREATAQGPQSTVARITSFGMAGIYRDEKGPMADVQPVANVHDSVTSIALFHTISELATIYRRIRFHLSEPIHYHHREFTIPVDIQVGFRWGEESMIEVKETGRLEEDLRAALDQAAKAY